MMAFIRSLGVSDATWEFIRRRPRVFLGILLLTFAGIVTVIITREILDDQRKAAQEALRQVMLGYASGEISSLDFDKAVDRSGMSTCLTIDDQREVQQLMSYIAGAEAPSMPGHVTAMQEFDIVLRSGNGRGGRLRAAIYGQLPQDVYILRYEPLSGLDRSVDSPRRPIRIPELGSWFTTEAQARGC